jgi:hypothetical protein
MMPSENSKTVLTPWSEIIGTLQGVFGDNLFIHVKVNGHLLSFANESRESEIILTKLKPLIGRKVGILKTDSVDNPLCIRLVK